MKNQIHLLILISSILFVFSCDKESDSQESQNIQNNMVELSVDDEIYYLNGPEAYYSLG